MSGMGQTRKIRACPLHVRFTPLRGRMLRRVPTSPLGQERTCRLAVNQRPVKVHYPNCGHGAASCEKCGG